METRHFFLYQLVHFSHPLITAYTMEGKLQKQNVTVYCFILLLLLLVLLLLLLLFTIDGLLSEVVSRS